MANRYIVTIDVTVIAEDESDASLLVREAVDAVTDDRILDTQVAEVNEGLTVLLRDRILVGH
jgi:hypothetical protein